MRTSSPLIAAFLMAGASPSLAHQSIGSPIGDLVQTQAAAYTGGSLSTNTTFVDDVKALWGTGSDYWVEYDSVNTAWEFWTTDGGGGTDTLLLSITDGGTILEIQDDIALALGDSADYWWIYDSGNTQFELNSSDCDGGGSDCIPITIDDGTDDVVLTGGMTIADDIATSGGAISYANNTIADGDATPDVSGGQHFTTSANTAPTAITDLDSPSVGAIYTICGGSDTNSSTIADSGNFNLSSAITLSVDVCIDLYVQADNDYIELGRSTGGAFTGGALSTETTLNDDVKLCLGTGCDTWIAYNSANGWMEWMTTDHNGGGVDDTIFRIPDAQDYLTFPASAGYGIDFDTGSGQEAIGGDGTKIIVTVGGVSSANFLTTQHVQMNTISQLASGVFKMGGTNACTYATANNEMCINWSGDVEFRDQSRPIVDSDWRWSPQSLVADDATPDLTHSRIWWTNAGNSADLQMTDLDGSVWRQVVTLCGIDDTNVAWISDGGNFTLSHGSMTLGQDECITFWNDEDFWVELSRSENTPHAEGYIDAGSQGVTLSVQNQWEEIDGCTSGDLQGFTQSGCDFTAGASRAGDYVINYSVSYQNAGAAETYQTGVSVGDTIEAGCRTSRKLSAGGDVGTVSASCIIDIQASEVLKLEVRSTAASPNNITVTDVSFTLHRI